MLEPALPVAIVCAHGWFWVVFGRVFDPQALQGGAVDRVFEQLMFVKIAGKNKPTVSPLLTPVTSRNVLLST
jgi:hypothetical protein